MTQEAEQAQDTEVSNQETTSQEAATDSQVADNQNEQTEPKPVYDHVNPAVDDPQKVQDRINYLYAKERSTSTNLKEALKVMEEQSKVIEELRSGTYAIANHLQQEKFADTEAQLKTQYRAALETGDIDAQITINDKLQEIKFQKLTAPKAPPKQQPQQEAKQQYNSATEVAADLDPQEQAVTKAWQDETDDSGQRLRPWTVNSTGDINDPDPDYIKALTIAQKVFTQDAFAHMNYQQKLQEIDKRMGVKKSTPQQNVMGANLTSHKKGGKVTITDKQKEIAIRTKYAGPKAKSDAEHIEAYKKQIEKVQSTKGAR